MERTSLIAVITTGLRLLIWQQRVRLFESRDGHEYQFFIIITTLNRRVRLHCLISLKEFKSAIQVSVL
jgi:hypothetical protein